MFDETYSREEARKTFGFRFVEIMMQDKREITLTDNQAMLAKKWKLLYDGHFRPFNYDYVYVASDGDGAVKVGVTNNPRRRVYGLQSSSAKEITLLHAFVMRPYTGRNFEKAAHRALKAQGKHISGEWFRDDKVVETLKDLADSNYRTSMLNLDAAWEGSEELMPVMRLLLKSEPYELKRAEQDRSDFLWLATILRLEEGLDIQDGQK